MNLTDVRGQPRAIRRLEGILNTGRVPTALLFTGPEGVGKKLAAVAFAKGLVCPDGGCGLCEVCSRIDKGASPQVRLVDAVYQAHLLEKDVEKDPAKALAKQRQWRVDTIRRICGEMQKRAFGGGWKAAIIDDAHRMNLDAQNALLKMLEEPPARTLWILVTSQPGKLLPTVRSRVQPIAFGRLPHEVVEDLLEDAGLAADEAALVAGAGSIQAALREKEGRELFSGLSGPAAPFDAAAKLPRDLPSQRRRVELALDHFAAQLRPDWPNDPSGVAARMRELHRLRRLLRRNVSPSMILEMAVLKTHG